VQIAHIVERHIVAEQAFDQRFDEAALELAVPNGRAQAQSGEYLEPDARIALRAPVEFVHQRIGLADSQRQSQHDARTNPRQGAFHAFGDVVENAHP
jgi:hypothetical protein